MKIRMRFVLFTLLLNASGAYAQLNVPAASPVSTVTQKFGLAEIKIEYCRPSINGRQIFGNVVPYDSIWRTGANDGTFFTTSDSITINGKGLAKGRYLIMTRPGKASWDIYFNKNLAASYTDFKPEENVFMITVPVQKNTSSLETFTIDIRELKSNAGNLVFEWENTLVKVPMENEIDSKIMAQIKQKLAGPTQGEYADMARYYLASGRNLNEALAFIDKSIAMSEGYGNLRAKALILAKMGNKKEAIVFAKKSMERAIRNKNRDYTLMNKESIAEWEKDTK